ncbi:MAG: hypothetical protein NDI61_06795 [Bdellovibrionaceae bacterium]|nr:hypothetical protein [Pseudobdellovibrionaceae bacterium]
MKRTLMTLLIAASFGMNLGCAKEKGGAASTPAPTAAGTFPQAPRGDGTGGSGTLAGSEVPLTVESRSRLAEFFFQEPVNDPQNIRIGMDVGVEGNGFGGELWIKFEDNGRVREAVLSTVHPWYSGVSDASKNQWFQYNGQTVFKGYFQDEYGAVIVVIDNTLSQGDGSPAELIGGTVYFQNFQKTVWQNPQQGPLRMCWQIELGPYDCRATMKVGTPSAWSPTGLYPVEISESWDTPYKRLGSFFNMVRSQAFH